jgi:CheY-like chemotaxis protein
MSNASILIVDDEPYLSEALTFILEKEGYEVETACDGAAALQKIAEKKPQIMFLDIMMPKKNGYEVLEIIRNTPETKDIYVIVLSAKGWESERAKGISLGANGFISKPYSPRDALNETKKALESMFILKSP